jgi:erythritol kinase
MTGDVIIGVDAGTSVIKAIAFTKNGEQIGSAAIPNSYVTLPNGGVEQDMARTWRDAVQALKQLSETVPELASRTVAISVTGQGDGMWLVDTAGEPVAPAWLWLDSRAASIAENVISHPGYPSHYKRTGTGVNACQMSVQLAWMAKHRPELLARAATAFHCKDWIYFKLTGERATDPSEGNFTFGEYRTRRYAPEILDLLGAAQAKRLLPPIVEGTEFAAALSSDAASLTGLLAGTPVTLGYVDVVCTALGGGLFDPQGRVGCTIVGSTGMHMRIAPAPERVKLNAEMSGYTMAFPVPGMYAQMQSNMASTLNIDWLLDLARGILSDHGMEKSRGELINGLDDKVLGRPAAQLLYHPYISQAGERGPFMEPAARAQFTGLELGMGFADLMRAIFEGLCMAARDCYTAMGDIPAEVRVTGGAARSRALRLMLASALNARVRTVSREEAGAAGAAMMAAIQQKLYPDMAACAAQWVDPMLGDITSPDAKLNKIYNDQFALYKETHQKMRPIWRAMLNNRREAVHAA